MTRPTFPIDTLLPKIHASLAAHPRLLLEAPTGAGKTTQVPLALLDAPWLADRKIVMLEPRRVAARAAAGFMARQLSEAVGETVGYRIRFERKVSASTRIEVVTEGILTRMLQDDPTLESVGALLFDEFHERHLAGDLGLALALDVQASLREDLRIVLMSATLDGERLAGFLDAPRLRSEGRSFPVTTAHFPARRDESLEQQVRRAVEQALSQHPGDVLVFLPGQREIAKVERALRMLHESEQVFAERGIRPHPDRSGLRAQRSGAPRTASQWLASSPHRPPQAGEGEKAVAFAPSSAGGGGLGRGRTGHDFDLLALHGELPIQRQSEVLRPDPHGRRRVVLATNVAESSVTLPGVRVVIDAGLAREPRYDPNSGFSRLDVVAISQASAEQRAGRAGRVAEGWAYRLWPQSQRLEPQRRPEIAQVELATLALELAAWGSDDLRFVDPPPPGALAAARDLLQRLGGLDATNSITPLGRRMTALGTHPRLAAMLLAPRDAEERALACDLAALLEARDPLRSRSDALADRWQALSAFRVGLSPSLAKQGKAGKGSLLTRDRVVQKPPTPPLPRFAGEGVNRSTLATIDAAATQWRRRLRLDTQPPHDAPAHALGDLLAHAFPDRIARQHPHDPRRYQLANGRMARLFDDSALFGEPWLVASELRFEAKDALLLRAAPLDETRLRRDFAERFIQRDIVRWDADKRALLAQREQRFDAIVLDTRPAGQVDPQHAAQALTDAVRELGLEVLPWSESLQQWRARAQCVRQWLPQARQSSKLDATTAAGLPDLSDAALLATLDDWLRPAFVGKSRLDALSGDEFVAALHVRVDWNARQAIDRLAPTRIAVPSGQQRGIVYAIDDSDQAAAPVLAVKLQELFGLADTPRICDGRIALTLHLLSPAGRPLQVTQDLRGFWERTYPDVRKEMKGRYPKHPWPEDPWSAQATHRAKPRRG